jgi:iron complex transport system substrate-binding protein
VASLLPAATEIVCALGLGSTLVGRSHECSFPPEAVRGVPILTRSRLGRPARGAEIDRDLRALLREALAVHEVDLEALERAAPEVVLTQDLCDVCAVPGEAVEAAFRALGRPGARLVRLAPTRLADVREDVRRVGRAIGAAGRAEALVGELEARIVAVRARAARLARRPSVLTLEWLEPPMVGGTWMPELVELAGGRPLVTRPGEHAPTLARAELARLDPAPEVVLVKPCGFTLERTLAERAALEALLEGLPWPALSAGAVFVADGDAYFNRPGPRLADSLEILAACVHPAEFADLAARHAAGFVRLDRIG